MVSVRLGSHAYSNIGGIKMKVVCCLLVIAGVSLAAETSNSNAKPFTTTERAPRFLSVPDPKKCAERPKEFYYKGHNYFFSGHVVELADKKVDWLDGRNICREYCMDLVSIETEAENNLIYRLLQKNDVPYIWTSGRLCDFKGCDRPDLEPKNIYGWFWSPVREKIPPTNETWTGWTYNPWSETGHKKQRQPDNAEFDVNGTVESCLGILNNVYGDGLTWHDVACYHEKPFICEDEDELLKHVATLSAITHSNNTFTN